MTPGTPAPNTQPNQALPKPPPKQHVSSFMLGFSAVCGILLPLVTLAVECATGWSAEIYVDPVPSAWYMLLVAWVPLANLLMLLAVQSRWPRYTQGLDWLNGVAIGLAGYYALLFLPIAPVAVIGILFWGMGLLPLAPLFSLLCALWLRRKLRSRLNEAEPPVRFGGAWRGILAAFGMIVLLGLPTTATLVGSHLAVSRNRPIELAGLRFLRAFGDRDLLLRLCYSRQGAARDPIGWLLAESGHTATQAEAQSLYYRVTGTPFNAVKPPYVHRWRARGMARDEWDFGLGGDAVAARVRGLSLSESRLDARIDADAALAYTEWTLVFSNTSHRQHEARAQIMLPPGGVVTRLTLWIDGEEREAAFGTRAQVKQAYRSVVRKRRDPVLVTTAGPDRVLMQCFPVPPAGGTMKVRLGITSPLALQSLAQGALRLPCFAERNFGFARDLMHAVWAESGAPLAAVSGTSVLRAENPGPGLYALRGSGGTLTADKPIGLRADRNAQVVECWTAQPRSESAELVQQLIRVRKVAPPARVVVVLDGSRRMAEFAATIGRAFQRWPARIETTVLLASDQIRELEPGGAGAPGAGEPVAARLDRARYAGGCNNLPALARAWDLAAQRPNSAILWLHAAQPAELGGIEALRQRWQRRPDGPALAHLQFGGGPNVVVTQLDGLPNVQSLSMTGDPEQDLTRLIAGWSATTEQYEFSRSAVDAGRQAGKRTSDHLARLWAFQRVRELGASRRQSARDEAAALATAFQLVTPVSGAVVLETAAQYKVAGLKPVDPETVPTMTAPSIPEPETWLLVGVVCLFLIVVQTRRPRLA
ncbi:MAG: hypothetical protein JXR37_13665 [Kiritimatiellae bacterium]|nr:hypothetical protein [Kiritimatiellia bacterium]